MPTLLTIGEVADATRLSKRTVARLIASGQLAHVRIGRSIRVTPEALEALIAACAQQGAA